ncbi:amino acid ABC transporter permease [Comamonas badia]|uniref:amino acid ABC transporter permease n=1 Tax=Comamonas badia TaxID=265291 RepID=UPI00046699EB|nr:amino acid ABC transporter permease [Comamonas badia]
MAMDWQVFCKDTLDQNVIAGCFGHGKEYTYLDWLLNAWGWTVSVSLTGLAIALIVGSIVGVIRTLPDSPWLSRFGNAWVELFRNIPLLVQIFLWYFVVPALVPPMKSFPPFILVVLALGLFTSARIAEQVRAGVQALPKGQRYAGMAMGFTTVQYYRYVLLPMAYRIIIPPLTSESMNIFKNSAVAFAVSIPELTQYALQVGEETARPIEVYLAVTVLYAISAFVINRIFAFIEKRSQVPGFVAAGTGAGGH